MKKLAQYFFTILAISFAIFSFPTSPARATDIAKVDSANFPSLKEAIATAEPGSTIELLEDSSASEPIVIDKSLTLNANGHKLTSTLTGIDAALEITTDAAVTINDLNVDVNTRGIAVNSPVHHLVVNGCFFNVGQRGITLVPEHSHDSSISINDSTFQVASIKNYDEDTLVSDTRGISIWQYSNSTVTLKNTTIQGFAYVVNLSPQGYDSHNTKIIIDGCKLKGRAGLNLWTKNVDIDLLNSEIVGINNLSGPTESFAEIVINQDSQVNLNVVDTTLRNFQNDVGQNNPNALQHPFSVRSTGNTISISGATTTIDTTGKLDSIFSPNDSLADNAITITGGTYDYDVSAYVPSGYEVKEVSGQFIVQKVTPPTKPDPDPTPDTPSIPSENITVDLPTSSPSSRFPIVTSPSEASTITNILTESFQSSDIASTLPADSKVSLELNLLPLNPVMLPSSTKDQFSAAANGQKLAQYLDISIIAKLAGERIGTLTNLTGKIKLSLELPADLLRFGRKFTILRSHDGVVESLPTSLDGNILSFETDKFSVYALAYSDSPPETSTPSGSPSPSTPETGALMKPSESSLSASFGIIALFASLALLLAFYLVHRRKASHE